MPCRHQRSLSACPAANSLQLGLQFRDILLKSAPWAENGHQCLADTTLFLSWCLLRLQSTRPMGSFLRRRSTRGSNKTIRAGRFTRTNNRNSSSRTVKKSCAAKTPQYRAGTASCYHLQNARAIWRGTSSRTRKVLKRRFTRQISGARAGSYRF